MQGHWDDAYKNLYPLWRSYRHCVDAARKRNSQRRANSFRNLDLPDGRRFHFTSGAREGVDPTILDFIRCVSPPRAGGCSTQGASPAHAIRDGLVYSSATWSMFPDRRQVLFSCKHINSLSEQDTQAPGKQLRCREKNKMDAALYEKGVKLLEAKLAEHKLAGRLGRMPSKEEANLADIEQTERDMAPQRDAQKQANRQQDSQQANPQHHHKQHHHQREQLHRNCMFWPSLLHARCI